MEASLARFLENTCGKNRGKEDGSDGSESTLDGETGRGESGEGESPADDSGAVLHDAESHACAGGGRARESGTIVVDGEGGLTVAVGEADTDFGGFAVFDGIGDGFLGDAVEVDGGVLGDGGRRWRSGAVAMDAAEVAGSAFGEVGEGDGEAF
jgi:hypothetical protein